MKKTSLFLMSGLLSFHIFSDQPPKINTQDTAIILPAFNKEQVRRLLKLDATPYELGVDDSTLPSGRGKKQPILHKDTFDALVFNNEAKTVLAQHGITDIPPYENWKIVSARFIPCARPTENIDGKISNVDQLDSKFTTERIRAICQLEHRLVAQPFSSEGESLPFSIHIINRPYRAGDPNSHHLSRSILNDTFKIKEIAEFNDKKPFGIYPNSDKSEVISRINKHIVTFYGGGLLRTLAFMASDSNQKKFAFWSGSSRNPDETTEGSFRFSNLIRPPQTGFPAETDSFQIMEVNDNELSVTTLDEFGNVLQPVNNLQTPSMYKFLKQPNDLIAQQEILDVNNTRKFFLPDLDCTSCHGSTVHMNWYEGKLSGERFKVTDSDITINGDSEDVLQNDANEFINLGYRFKNGKNYLSVAQVTINDAAMTSDFINKSITFWSEGDLSRVESFTPAFYSNDLLRIDSFSPAVNTRELAKTSNWKTPPEAISLKSGITIFGGQSKAFQLGKKLTVDDLPIQLTEAESQLIADYLNVTGVVELKSLDNKSLKMSIMANERDEVRVEYIAPKK